MIVLDIETSGLSPQKNGIWQIGALDISNPENTFLEESNIDNEDELSPDALKVIGKKENDLRNSKKQSQKELIKRFFFWTQNIKIKNPICQNPQFDLSFLQNKADKYSLEMPIPHRAFDLHSIASFKHYQIKKEFPIKENKSAMNLSKILELCGINDERIQLINKEIIKQGKPHSALKDAKLTAECFSRIVYKKKLLPEFAKFEIPMELTQ